MHKITNVCETCTISAMSVKYDMGILKEEHRIILSGWWGP